MQQVLFHQTDTLRNKSTAVLVVSTSAVHHGLMRRKKPGDMRRWWIDINYVQDIKKGFYRVLVADRPIFPFSISSSVSDR